VNQNNQEKFRLLWIIAVLAFGTAALYSPIASHPFIVFDDEQYISANNHVATGLSATNAVWAFTTGEQANWHPLTWLSHQLDCSLFGLNAGAHHFISLLFHVANTLLLFVFLRNVTGSLWRSAFVAALFAWHPLHVESVAWAAERKDVLSTFFWLLTLMAYGKYGQTVKADPISGQQNTFSRPLITPRAAGFYLLTLAFFACGLMSKPMVVTLPFVLLLLDFWPLQRIYGLRFTIYDFRTLLLEKIPFFLLAIAGSVVTYLVQAGGGAVAKTPWIERLANAALAYARYTGKLFWPSDLAVVYPHPKHWPLALALGAAAVLLAWTLLCVRDWRRRPFLAVGWFWFLGTLVPTIGLVQVGAASMADRYTYIPSIGFFIVVVWGAAEVFSKVKSRRIILPAAGGAALIACALVTAHQISFWRDSIALFRHAMEVTTDNYVAESTLGKAYEKAGDNVRALACYQMSVDTEPRFPNSQFNLAMSLLKFNRSAEAMEHLQAAATLEARDPQIEYELGICFLQQGALTNAADCFSNSVAIRPAFAPAQLALGTALANLAQFPAAANHFREALQLDPALAQAKANLDRLLMEHPELRPTAK
jgi:protein O-mannosyl-transferase